MRKPITKRTKNLILFLSIIVLSSLVSLVTASTIFMVKDKIYNGIMVGEIDVGGMSVADAQDKIHNYFIQTSTKSPVVLQYQEQYWNISAQEIDLKVDAVKLATEAYQVGRTGNIINQLKDRYLAVNYGIKLPFEIQCDQNKLFLILSNIAKTIDQDARNALLTYDGINVAITPEIIGRKLDVGKSFANVMEELNAGIPVSLPLSVAEISPNTVSADLRDIDGIISIYTTEFDPANSNRVQNITLAAISMDHTLVRAGEVFSFNDRVGLRLAKNGYKEAPVFIDGKLVPDFGGGVCQVSSTLYNAVLLANLVIDERTSHFRPPGYVPVGQDATVADNLLDFKFKNSLSNNIYLTVSVFKDRVTVYVFGKRSTDLSDVRIVTTNKKIIEPNTIIKQDPTLELGKEVVEIEGQKGFEVSTYRIIVVNNQEIKREFISSDDFKPEDRVVRVGTKIMTKQRTNK